MQRIEGEVIFLMPVYKYWCVVPKYWFLYSRLFFLRNYSSLGPKSRVPQVKVSKDDYDGNDKDDGDDDDDDNDNDNDDDEYNEAAPVCHHCVFTRGQRCTKSVTSQKHMTMITMFTIVIIILITINIILIIIMI